MSSKVYRPACREQSPATSQSIEPWEIASGARVRTSGSDQPREGVGITETGERIPLGVRGSIHQMNKDKSEGNVTSIRCHPKLEQDSHFPSAVMSWMADIALQIFQEFFLLVR